MKQSDDVPCSGVNYAAELINDRTGASRTLPIAPNLTHEEAVKAVTPWLAKDERIAQFVEFKFAPSTF